MAKNNYETSKFPELIKTKEIVLCPSCGGQGDSCVRCKGTGRVIHVYEEKWVPYSESAFDIL